MRTILILLICALACSSKKLSMKQALREGCIQLFEHCGYEGRSRVICRDDPAFYNDNDYYSAIKLGPQTTATLYENYNYEGKFFYFNTDVECFYQNINPDIAYLNDKVSAVRINIPPPGCVWLYADCDYKGQMIATCDNIPDLRSLKFNDKLSAIKLGASTSIQLFEHINYEGRNLFLNKDEWCLNTDYERKYMNDIVSSIKIIKN
jgi:hypothetical protein